MLVSQAILNQPQRGSLSVSPCMILKAIRTGVGWVWLARLGPSMISTASCSATNLQIGACMRGDIIHWRGHCSPVNNVRGDNIHGGTLFTEGDNIHWWIMSGGTIFTGGHYSLRHRYWWSKFGSRFMGTSTVNLSSLYTSCTLASICCMVFIPALTPPKPYKSYGC